MARLSLSTLFAPLVCFFFLLIPSKSPALERIYSVSGNTKHIVDKVMKSGDDNEAFSEFPAAKLYIKYESYPSSKYYKLEIRLLEPIKEANFFVKTLEMWEKNGIIIVRSRVDIGIKRHRFPLRWVNFIKNSVVYGVEEEILEEEYKEILKVSREKK